ncbi:MAG: hypothetical protein HY319_28550 [Armatimonadetes bacterium]|nr:hypothetical protein [Armatimonadota bacterium]
MTAILQHVAELHVDPGIAFEGLTLFAVRRPGSETVVPDYLTLDDALERQLAQITELSQAGSVPELRFVNKGKRPILLLDGEELVGAKQNRVLNVTLLAGAGRKLDIPVSCVERGRWAYKSATFSSGGSVHYSSGRARKVRSVSQSRSSGGGYRSNQAEVWGHIHNTSVSLGSVSLTSAIADVYKDLGPKLEAYDERFSPLPDQVGVIGYVPGKVLGLDLFDAPCTLGKLYSKLVRSYALDALQGQAAGIEAEESAPSAAEFLSQLAACETRSSPSVGEGQDIRLQDELVHGAGLHARGRLVHLIAFRLLEKDPATGAAPPHGPAPGQSVRQWVERFIDEHNFPPGPAPAELEQIVRQVVDCPHARQRKLTAGIEIRPGVQVADPPRVRRELWQSIQRCLGPEQPASPPHVLVSAFVRDDVVVVHLDDGSSNERAWEFPLA